MACGTGKTFTSLKIAEEHVGAGGAVLFLAPSIALVSQSLKEWTAESAIPLRPFAVCSDVTAGKPIEGENALPYDLPIPPTTSVQALIDASLAELPEDAMTVVFSTYQSIQVIADVQTATDLTFDLVVADEAHRTTGVSGLEDEDLAFVKVHDNTVVPAHRRLYMTATPRIYKPAAKADAAEHEAVVASMDDPEIYGPEFHRLGFGESVGLGLLADYRVLILTVDESAISRSFQNLLSTNGELNLPDVAKFIGCLSGLSKLPSASGEGGFAGTEPPMRRAVAFWSTIKESERFAAQFDVVADHYNQQRLVNEEDEEIRALSVPTRHVDGTDKISSRRRDLRWLKETPPEDECRVLTNARCLTEGVDVPALDAVMFLKPKRSKIDIVQAVGRVMRNPPGKTMGYIILPVAIPAGQDPSTALDRNDDYDVVWDVLQALRSHDERFNAYINRIALLSDEPGDDPDGPIEVIDATPQDQDPEEDEDASDKGIQSALFTFEEWSGAIYAKIVKKVGTRTYWEDWAKDVADIAGRHSSRTEAIVEGDPEVARAFDHFVLGLRSNLNDSISTEDAIAMLSQHLITSPIFEALFGSNSFALSNPVSKSMQAMVDILDEHHLDTETESLDDFYNSVRRRVEGIPEQDGAARQRIIKDLYGRFFAIAFPKVAEALGIVYTPVEAVDFILRATEAALNEHFGGASLSDPGVHILDPFTGTGTFITRLLQSGAIRPHDLARKYASEVHANEILLLAYYIAAVNIETTYQHELRRLDLGVSEEPFPGIVLTDTFQLGEAGEGTGVLDVFPINNERALRQRDLDIRVILGNPPWSAGQRSTADYNPNLPYPSLDASISATYAGRSTATLKNSLYDSYVRAIRWASNRILDAQHGGVVTFVTNGGYIDSNVADGLRLTLADEFHHVYVYNLRGNARTAGELRRKEAGNIFESDTRATVGVLILVKKSGPVQSSGATIQYRDIGDYLSREKKLAILDSALRSSDGIAPSMDSIGWVTIQPNERGDWINQRSKSFGTFTPAHSDGESSIFQIRTRGLATTRDAWNYNASLPRLKANVERMIAFYNSQVEAFSQTHPNATGTATERATIARDFVDRDPTKFSWDRSDFQRMVRGEQYTPTDALYMTAIYRPFYKRHVNAGPKLNNTVYQMPRVYPGAGADNLTICVRGLGMNQPFSAIATNHLPDVQPLGNAMNYPKYVYESPEKATTSSDQTELFEDGSDTVPRRHNVTDYALDLYQRLDEKIDKDAIFFYVYGVLHSPTYRRTFAADLMKVLPRIPEPATAEDFWAFSDAGRALVELHTKYEHLPSWPDLTVTYAPGFDADAAEAFRIEKMRYPKVPNPDDPDGRKIADKTMIICNSAITVRDIPERVHEYRLGARSALDWVVENYRVRTHTASGIVNDPNHWADEHNDPTYDLLGKVVTMSVRTLDIVDGLPDLDL